MTRIHIKNFNPNSEDLFLRTKKEKKIAELILQKAKALNRPVKFIRQGFSYQWEKEKEKIKKQNELKLKSL